MKTLNQLESFMWDYLPKVHGENFSDEKDFEKDLMTKLQKDGFDVESQLSTQSLNDDEKVKLFTAEGAIVPDLVVKVEEGFIPIELKFDNTPTLYKKDEEKICRYVKNFSDVPEAWAIFLDKHNHEDYDEGWTSIANSAYRYKWRFKANSTSGNLKLADVWNERRKNAGQGPKKTSSPLKSLLLLFALMIGIGNAWGASVSEGTYNFVNQTIGAKTKFYKINNGIYQYRLNAYTKNSDLGIQLPSSGDGTGFAFHLESTQKVYIGICKKNVKAEVVNNLYIKTITEANFSAIEAGTNNSTTVTLSLAGSATLSQNYTFAAISSAKTEGATVYMGELPAGYYYAYGNSTGGNGNLYSISFGTQTLFLVPNDKTSDNAKFAIYYWMGATGYERQGWSDYMTVSPCNSSTYRADIPKGYTNVIFVRLDPSGGRNWNSKWNQTGNLTFDGSKDLFTWANGSWDNVTTTWSASTKYTISFAANGGTGSMSNVSSIACGRSVKLAANAYTKSGYVFAGWKTNVAVTANGEAVAANGIVADEATISNITSNITLTAQWNADVACTATQPGSISKSLSACTLTLTASGDPASNNTWYWQSAADGTATNLGTGATKTVTTTGTWYIRSYCSDGSGCWSEAQTVTVSASDLTPAAPTALASSSPTAKGVTLTVTDAANTNDYEFYVNTSSSAPSSGTSASYTSTSKSVTITDKYAGTTFYAWARAKCGSNKSAWTALTGNTFTTSTVTVTHTLTNVSKTSGGTTAGGSDYTAVYTADAEYSMPTPTVTIDGNTATSGTDYTWSDGTLTIPANKINGNIAITLNSADAAPSSAVISGTYHYFPEENISLTCTPSGNNGPTTYQWYKGGKENGNAIAGATSATYTKNSCTFDDAGSYYCKVTCNATSIWANTNSSENYDVKILRLYVNGSRNGDAYGNVDFVKVNGTTATASIALGAGWTYGFSVADGCGTPRGNSGTMTENNCTGWTMNSTSGQCAITTTNAATYIFTVNYSNLSAPVVSVTYPVGNQAADKVIYFDNSGRNWSGSSIYYRIGHSSHSQARQLSLVSGTANLYKMTTTEYNGFSGWHIANATGDVGSGKSIYKTVDGTPITEATAHEGGAVTQEAITVTPTTSKGYGADVGVNDNCEFYNYTITNGMKTDAVSITAPSNGTITVAYTDVAGASQSFTSGSENLAHTVIITPTATPSTGYKLSGLTVNASAHTSGSKYTVTGATTVAATFAAKQSAITFDKNSGTGGATGTTGTYGSAMTTVTVPTRLGYTFDGYWDAETGDDGSGTKYYNADGTSARTWDKNTESATTLYAKWVAVECPAAGSGETVYKFVPVTSSTDNVASSSGAELTTSDYMSALVNGHVYAYGSSASNVTMTSSGVKVASSTGYMKLDFDCALIAGDQIKWKSDQNSINLCNTTSYNSSNDLTLAKSNSSYSTVEITSAMVGEQTLYLVYNTGVATMIYFEIIRPEGYSVTYKANGGTGSDVVRIHATAASLATVGFTRAGYDFTGWKTGASSGTDYKVGDEITEEITLYAQWTCVTPTFGTNLSTSQVDYEQNATASALTVAATANGTGGNGTVGYQWYSNTTNSTAGATPLTGQTSTSYTPSTEEEGTTYYFCRVTNTSSGCATTTDSKIAKIVVSEAPCFKITDAGKNGSSWPKSNGNTIANSDIDGTITGGSVTYSGSGSLTGNDTHGIIFDNDNDELTILLSGSHSLVAGSVITIVQHGNSSTSKETGFKISGNSMSPATCNNGSTTYKEMTQTYTVVAADGVAGHNSFTIKWTGTNQVYLKSMTVTGCVECTPITPSLTYSKSTFWMDDATLTATATLTGYYGTPTITYTSSDPTVVRVDNASTGAITALKRGTATITATIGATTYSETDYCGNTATCNITVKDMTCGMTLYAVDSLYYESSTRKASVVNATNLMSGLSGSSVPFKLNSKPSWFGLRMATNFQVGDSVVFKIQAGDLDYSGTSVSKVPVKIFLDRGTTGLYEVTGATKTKDTLISMTVTQAMITAGLTDSLLIYRSTDAASPRYTQNHKVYWIKVYRYACPDIYMFDAADNSNWSDEDNWIGPAGHGSGLPTNEDRVFINESVTIDVATAAAAEMNITNGSMVTVEKSITVGDVNIETGSTLNIAKDGESGITVATNSLYLKGGWNSSYTTYDMPRIYIDPASTLTKVVNTVNLDISVDANNYYPIAVPFKVKVSDVDYANSTLAGASTYGTHYVIKDYDGARRAGNGPDRVNNWKVVPETESGDDVYLEPGRGYIMTAVSIPAYGGGVIRFPMTFTNDWTAEGEKGTVDAVTKNVVAVKAYEGAATAGDKKVNKGWNLLGVPFMSCYGTGADMGTDGVVMQGKFDFKTGDWKEEAVRYVNVPVHDFSEYIQVDMEDDDPVTVLRPDWCFFVQVEEDGDLTFLTADQAASSSLPIYAPKRGVKADMPTVKTGIILSDGEKSDKTTFLVSDKYNGAEYEINADMEKMFGNGYTLATYSLSGTTRLAYNALGNADAANIIPIGYRAPADGEYTFSINPRYAENGAFENVNLIDYETGIVTDLLKFSYTFSTERTQNDTRFALNVVKQKETPTDIELVGGDAQVDSPRKLLLDGKMYIILDGKMFDAQGKRVQ